MATHSSILAWRIPWIEEPGGLQSMWSQRVGGNRATRHIQPECLPYLENYGILVTMQKKKTLFKNHDLRATELIANVFFFSYQVLIFSNK